MSLTSPSLSSSSETPKQPVHHNTIHHERLPVKFKRAISLNPDKRRFRVDAAVPGDDNTGVHCLLPRTDRMTKLLHTIGAFLRETAYLLSPWFAIAFIALAAYWMLYFGEFLPGTVR